MPIEPDGDEALDRRAALERRLLGRRIGPREAARIKRLTGSGPFFLSAIQHRIWAADQIATEPGTNNILRAERLRGPLSVDHLRRAFDDIVARHDVLRSRVVVLDGIPMGKTLAKGPSFRFEKRAGTRPEDRDAIAGDIVRDHARMGFDLTADPPFRATLVEFAPDDFLLVYVVHHIACDEWSMRNLQKELARAYRAHTTAEMPDLPDLPIGYADFAAWQKEWVEGPGGEQARAYWASHLEGAPAECRLPFAADRRSVAPGDRAVRHVFQLDGAVRARLDGLALQHAATPFMAMLAATMGFLHQAGSQPDLAISSLAAGRVRPELDDLVGMFANTFVTRTRIQGEDKLADLLASVRGQVIEALRHQNLPFDSVIRELGLNAGDLPFQTVMFTHRDALPPAVSANGIESTPIQGGDGGAKFGLWVSVIDAAPDRTIRLTADGARYDSAALAELAGAFAGFLDRLSRAPETPLVALQPGLRSEGSGRLSRRGDDGPMPDPVLERRVASLWQATLRKPPRSPTSSFLDEGGDSLLLMQLVFLISREIGPELPMIDVFVEPTVRGLARLCEARLSQAQGSAGVSQRRDDPSIVPLNGAGLPPGRAGARHPFFVVSGAGGHVLPFAPMSRRIEERWQAIGLLDPLFEPGHAPLNRLADVAERLVDNARRADPEGPYLFVGYSYGGFAAFEMARQLHERGHAAGLVVLDTRVRAASLVKQVLRAARLGPVIVRRMLFRGRGPQENLWTEREGLYDDRRREESARRTAMLDHQTRLASEYRPRFCDIPVVVLRASGSQRAGDADDYGWSAIARVVGSLETKGTHLTLFQGEHEAEFAAKLDEALTLLREDIAVRRG